MKHHKKELFGKTKKHDLVKTAIGIAGVAIAANIATGLLKK